MPLFQSVQVQPQDYAAQPSSNFPCSQRTKENGNHGQKPFDLGFTLPPDIAFRITHVVKAKTDKEPHIYNVEPVDPSKIVFQVTENQMLRTKSFRKGQKVWHTADTGSEIVTVIDQTVKQRKITYSSDALRLARSGRVGESDMVARVKYQDSMSRDVQEGDADKFEYATDEEVRKELNLWSAF